MIKSLAIAAAVAANMFAINAYAGSAQAEFCPGECSSYAHEVAASTSALTREQVRQDFLKARAEGRLVTAGNNNDYPMLPSTPSTLTRAQVEGQYLQAAVGGQLPLRGNF
jgi:uncharacterized protein YyaL (SSP411 family)